MQSFMLYLSMNKLLILSIAFLLCGCGAEQRFITIGTPPPLHQKKIDDVLVFSSPSQVPWPYQEIGELIPDKAPRRFQTPVVQIDDIKREAAKNGADAVILHKDVGQRGDIFIGQGSGFGNTRTFLMFSGTAIVKKDQVASFPATK